MRFSNINALTSALRGFITALRRKIGHLIVSSEFCVVGINISPPLDCSICGYGLVLTPKQLIKTRKTHQPVHRETASIELAILLLAGARVV